MRANSRPDLREWFVGIAAGAVLGLVFLGLGGRVGMRVMALAAGQEPRLTFEGTLTVIALGGAAGSFGAGLALGARAALPRRPWAAVLVWALVCTLVTLRGLSPVTPLSALVFLPLLGIYCWLLLGVAFGRNAAAWRRSRAAAMLGGTAGAAPP